MSNLWERWQGHAVNGVFPLQRYLGASDHSGVFLTQLPKGPPCPVAIKLVAASRGDKALVDLQLARWKIASGLAHPQLLPLLETGRCELDGLWCAYAVMEYADQTLAQLLLHRALSEAEAREMLVPVLDALAFVHGRGFVHGGLKPPNILVVGEQLKLASDTLRISSSAAADIQGLGRTLMEALTRRVPAASGGEQNEAVALPEEVSAELRDVVARCLSRRPEDRPDVARLRDWIRGRSTRALPPGAAGREPPEAPALEPRLTVSPVESTRPQSPRPALLRPERRAALPVAPVVAAALVLGWMAVHQIRKAHSGPAAPAVPATHASQGDTTTGAVTELEAPPVIASSAAGGSGIAADPGSVAADPTGAALAGPGAATIPAPQIHEAIPAVPLSARETIQGHLKVWVRVSVDREGRVVAVHADRPGPSHYFERLALEAARKWSFPAVETSAPRLMQVRFEFSRHGTTGRAVALR
ncbi:MAG: TonB family protein [Gammaproteobacteria bacterium]|nr:TonB family protein [Gammaproteobacteria bacterium]